MRVQSASGVTLCGLLCELWARHCQRVSSNNYCAKVTQANSNNGDSGDRCIKKVKSPLSVFGKGQKSQKVSDTVCDIVMFRARLCMCTSLKPRHVMYF